MCTEPFQSREGFVKRISGSRNLLAFCGAFQRQGNEAAPAHQFDSSRITGLALAERAIIEQRSESRQAIVKGIIMRAVVRRLEGRQLPQFRFGSIFS